jgi:hypothetical protein
MNTCVSMTYACSTLRHHNAVIFSDVMYSSRLSSNVNTFTFSPRIFASATSVLDQVSSFSLKDACKRS